MTKIMRLLLILLSLSIVLGGCNSFPEVSQQSVKSELKEEIQEADSQKKTKDLLEEKEVSEAADIIAEDTVKSPAGEVEEIELPKSSQNENADEDDISNEPQLPVKIEKIDESPVHQEPQHEEKAKVQITRKGKLAGYGVEVANELTPAAYTIGEYTSAGAFYQFYSENDEFLGRLPDKDVGRVIMAFGLSDLSSEEHFGWFTDQFNLYRGIECHCSERNETIMSPTPKEEEPNLEDFAEQVVLLTNEERSKYGLVPLTIDATAKEYAEIRVKEIESDFSHTDMSYRNCSFAENIAKGHKSPEDVVKGWMLSPGHRDAILADYSEYGNRIGVGCLKGFDGKYYWVQEFVIWDANY